MINLNEFSISDAVLGQHAECENPRLKTVMTSLVNHLHNFAREVRLSEDEWMLAIDFLTRVGHITDDRRQEFILLSDTLGLSMLVNALNNQKDEGCTESTVFGPFFIEDAPHFKLGDDIAQGASGELCFVSGRVLNSQGEGIADAEIQVWQCDDEGFYDVQYAELAHAQCRGVLHGACDGGFNFRSVLPVPYPIPHDGPVGQMLEALGRHPWRPAHLHFMIKASGYQTLITHVFRDDDQYLASDAVFGVRSSLVAQWLSHPAGPTPDGTHSEHPFHSLNFDFVLQTETIKGTTDYSRHSGALA